MKDYAVLIPTKGRPKQLRKLFEMCPSLNTPSTYIGLDDSHCDVRDRQTPLGDYAMLFESLRVTVVPIANPGGYTSVAREQLRQRATKGRYTRFVLVDDNCRFTDSDLRALLRAQKITKAVVAGCHPTAEHFHAGQIANTTVDHGDVHTYEQVGMIFWCVPGKEYRAFTYPNDCYFDDVYLIFWLLSKGFTDFRSCPEAKFVKHLHQPGGTGNVATRIRKRGEGFVRLATDFPRFMTTGILGTRVPYKQLIRAAKAGKRGV